MYLFAAVFTLESQWRQHNVFLKGVPLFDALVRIEHLYPGARNFVTKN